MNEHLLKSVAIYGANASGKSNIIKAIQLSVQMILQSHLYNENVVFNIAPFKFEDFPKKPSFFRIRFIMNGIEYEYSFSFSRNEIFTEELYYYPNGRRAKIFTRNESAGKEKSEIYSFGSAIRKPLDVAENTSAQIVYTTHNTNLLNLNRLRKDQIYFVNKKDDGSSDLYSLPYIDDSLENLKTIIK